MVFSSLEFIFIFLPIFLVFYFPISKKYKNILLFLFSIFFYAYGSLKQPFFILLILGSVIVNYFLGLKIEKSQNRKRYLLLGILYNFGWLFLFKYCAFFTTECNRLLESLSFQIPVLDFVLPIGISFYTFQTVSYLVDVYRGEVKAEKNFVRFGTYITMFPQLIAGPIVTYKSIRKELETRKNKLDNFYIGLKFFILGLGYKVLLANRIGSLWTDIQGIGFDSISTPLAYLGIIAFTFQIYFDFYGYSLMAIGLGKMMGFTLPINFDYPYLSRSMTEFWRRWHITLGSWFKKYVYIPLGGNRKGMLKTIRNLFIVWLLTGLWHGASWNFVLWGFVIFIVIVLEKVWLKPFLDKHKIFSRIYMMVLIPFTWTIFAVTDMKELGNLLARLNPFTKGINVYALDYVKYLQTYGILLLIGFFFCTRIPDKFLKNCKNNLLEIVLYLAIFWFSIYCLCMEANDPFLYFRF